MQFINFSRLLVLSASTRSLYERKLQKLLDHAATQVLVPEAVPAEIGIHHNGTADPDLYSDKEDGKKKQKNNSCQTFNDEMVDRKTHEVVLFILKASELWTDTHYCQV